MKSTLAIAVYFALALCQLVQAQDPVGAMEGVVTDKSSAPAAAHVTARNMETRFVREQGPITIDVSQPLRLDVQLEVAAINPPLQRRRRLLR